MNAPTAGFIGKAVLRREDQRFLTGNGQYTDDIVHQGQTYAVFVRSPHAHAKLLKVDTEAAPRTSMRHRIRSIPTMALFRNGTEVARTSGAMSAADIARWVHAQLS